MDEIAEAIGMVKQPEYLWKDIPAGVPCWHIHHEQLLEWSTQPLNERADYIRTGKPKHEVELRLRLMRPVKGKLPKAVLEAGDKADAAWGKAYAASDKASAAWGKASAAGHEADTAWHKANAAWHKASAAGHEADTACRKTLAAHMPEIEALHAKECPNCPWDGKTIFPEEKP